MNKLKNKLLELFNVDSYEKLSEFIEENPEDERVLSLIELIDKVGKSESK